MVYGFIKQIGRPHQARERAGPRHDLPPLPAALGEASQADRRAARPAASRQRDGARGRGRRTAVRDFAASVLRELGYRVLEAVGRRSRARRAGREAAIDLLFTDVVMPGRRMAPSSPAPRARRRRRCAFSSPRATRPGSSRRNGRSMRSNCCASPIVRSTSPSACAPFSTAPTRRRSERRPALTEDARAEFISRCNKSTGRVAHVGRLTCWTVAVLGAGIPGTLANPAGGGSVEVTGDIVLGGAISSGGVITTGGAIVTVDDAGGQGERDPPFPSIPRRRRDRVRCPCHRRRSRDHCQIRPLGSRAAVQAAAARSGIAALPGDTSVVSQLPPDNSRAPPSDRPWIRRSA